ncbi:MerR family transcriptional regulator [Cellulomonas phragmiteti]|uniref:MerR family transcriptional regulator n=1 Tax=Cellulomonas phragmiteti TaxID=478780 RepID=A0ABQ4DMX0_9CELL|nr:MerR family transcriptional regulator [Cellulomonas phragmiteti]GIG40696.1 MerR family transcriptional regulator [Cellulomonas phragmiteti]
MDHDAGLLRIGAFSTLSRISVRMLRYYQEHGVLVPAAVDPCSGYRWYRAEQLTDAHLAVLLRDAGFTVEAIARLLTSTGDPAGVEAAVTAQRAELARRGEDLRAQQSALDRVSTALGGRTTMHDVTLTTFPATTVAALRRILPGYADEGLLWQEMTPLLGASGAVPAPEALAGATFHDPDHRESDVDVEVWLQVTGPFEAVAPLTCRTEPQREAAVARLTGDYTGIPAVMASLGAFVAAHRLETGPMFNVYRVGPGQSPDPADWVTDVCLPVVRS